MDLVTPAIGLVFWMTVTFVVVLLLLRKFAWKPLLGMLKSREESIHNALQSAERARTEMTRLQADNEALLQEARNERDMILREAREMKDKIVSDARNAADEEGKKMIAKASEEINKQKAAAISELKNQVASFSVEIAEKLLSKKLENNSEQQALIEQHLKGLEQGQKASSNG